MHCYCCHQLLLRGSLLSLAGVLLLLAGATAVKRTFCRLHIHCSGCCRLDQSHDFVFVSLIVLRATVCLRGMQTLFSGKNTSICGARAIVTVQCACRERKSVWGDAGEPKKCGERDQRGALNAKMPRKNPSAPTDPYFPPPPIPSAISIANFSGRFSFDVVKFCSGR